MALLKSVSGIRGTIGGLPGDNLTPPDIVAFTSAYATWLKSVHPRAKVVTGRDGRSSGMHISSLVTQTLLAMGIDVIDAGLTTTPSLEMYVVEVRAQGGIMITASHNPEQWNALKFLNEHGEFISQEAGRQIVGMSEEGRFTFAGTGDFGTYAQAVDVIGHHVDRICALELVDRMAIRKQNYHVVVDCINSTGALAIPALLDALGCTYTLINDRIQGRFAHNPEPLAQHLGDLCEQVIASKGILGVAVDPDVDRLALVDENGKYFGEEYTLIAVADYVLQHTPGPCVSNLSSSRALEDLAASYGQPYSAAMVGEVHVVTEMKSTGAVIGGEGNGGVIYPVLHYGRDALVGIALLLSYMAKSGQSPGDLKRKYPSYVMAKYKVELKKKVDIEDVLGRLAALYENVSTDRRDGLKIIWDNQWVHLRASNTEPVVRIYSEAPSATEAQRIAQEAQERLLSLS